MQHGYRFVSMQMTTTLGEYNILPGTGPRWWACEHPERAPDDYIKFHGSQCHGCFTVATALQRRGEVRGALILDTWADADTPKCSCWCFAQAPCDCIKFIEVKR